MPKTAGEIKTKIDKNGIYVIYHSESFVLIMTSIWCGTAGYFYRTDIPTF